MSHLVNFSRRTFLKSSAACLALPCLDTFAETKGDSSKQNTKMIFMTPGFGFTPVFYPKFAGRFSEIGLTDSLKPLAKHINEISLLDNLVNLGHNDPHAGSITFLTGAPFGSVRSFKQTISCDQLAAEHLSQDVRYKSLVVSTYEWDGHRCHSISHNEKGHGVPGSYDSLELYRKLFASNESVEQMKNRLTDKGSILDVIKLDQKNMNRKIAKSDKDRLEAYFDAIRDIETGIDRQRKWLGTPKPKAPFKYPEELDAIAEVKLIHDMLILALQAGQTNIATYTMPQTALIKSMGIGFGAHALSHKGSNEDARTRDVKHMELLAYFLDKLKSTKDTHGRSLYESSLLAYGTNIRNEHITRRFPVILSGGAIKNLKLGEHLRLPKDTPLQNVWLTLLQECGIPIKKFSTSTGRVPQLLS